MDENIGSEFKVKRGDSLRNKPWMVSTFVLGILVILLVFGNLSGITGKVVSSANIGKLALDFANENLLSSAATLDSVKKVSGVYQVNLDIKGDIISLYFTKDGNWIAQGGDLVSIFPEEAPSNSGNSGNTQTTEIPKTDKPSVELYVFTYCPYGTQAEKGILPVVELLGDKIDFNIRQIGAMHGEHEKIEAERQLCIEKNYPDKFLDYVLAFDTNADVGACNGLDTCVNPLINSIYTKLGISATKINSCMTSDGVTMYNSEVSNSQSVGVSGSPTLIVNGVKVSSARDSASYLNTICRAFSDGNVPSECGEQLSSTSPSPGFGAGTGSSSGTQCA